MDNNKIVKSVMDEFKATYSNELKALILDAVDLDKNEQPGDAFDLINDAADLIEGIENLVYDYLSERLKAEDALNNIRDSLVNYIDNK